MTSLKCSKSFLCQLIVVMLGKQVMNNIVEFLWPKMIHMWKSYVYRSVAS